MTGFASANLLTGGDFEQPVVGTGSAAAYGGGSGAINGWLVVGSQVALVDTNYSESWFGVSPFNSHQGNQYLDLTGIGNNGTSSGVTQTFASVQGTQYIVKWWECVSYSSNGSSPYTQPSIVDLSWNGGTRTSFVNNDSSVLGSNVWHQYSAIYTATATTSSVTFYCGYGGFDNNNIGIDDIEVEAVPEPGSLAVLGLGAVALLKRRRK